MCPFAYVVKEQVCLDALLASLSGKNHFPGRDPTRFFVGDMELICPQNLNSLKESPTISLIPDPNGTLANPRHEH